MANVLRLAIVDPNDAAREQLKTVLLGLDLVWLEAECSRYEFFSDVIAQTHPDIGVVALDADPDKAIKIEDLVGAMERLSERQFGKGDGKVRGSQVIAICGSTGGVGTTSLAVNMGCALGANAGNSVCLIDLDLSL